MFERLTDNARKAMAYANEEARRFNHQYIGTEHILLGLLREGSGRGAQVLQYLDIDLRKVRLEVEKIVKAEPKMVTMGKLPLVPPAKKVIEYAIEEARNLNHSYVGTEHLLLGLIREGQSTAWWVLSALGVKLEETRSQVLEILQIHSSEDGKTAGGYIDGPFELPANLELRLIEGQPSWAWLSDQAGRPLSPPMQIELAREIVMRYNAYKG